VTSQYTGKNNKGQVINQNPPAGILVKKGAAVSIVVSGGIHFVLVPTGLIGLPESQAVTALSAAGLKVGQIVSKNSPLPANQVLLTNPAVGSNVPAGSSVTLTVSNARTKVPDVTNQDPATATAILQQHGFTNIVQKRSATYNKKQDGLVVSQTPTAGSYATPDTTIIIYVDQKAPKPTSSPTPSATATPTEPPTVTPSPPP
jgi:serine/threonine-protein kinase